MNYCFIYLLYYLESYVFNDREKLFYIQLIYMKKFYIVNNHKDLLSGKVIPHKVLDYLPVNMGPLIQPIPITKHTGLTISSESPISMMPIMPFGDPYSNVTITRTPLIPGFGSVSTTSNIYGPPIIKMSPLINQGMMGTVKIISDNNVFTLNIPFSNLRNVVNYIYLNAQTNLDPTQPKVTFRIITPTIDSSISTTFNKMYEIVKEINNKYTDIVYLTPDGRRSNLLALLQTLYSNLSPRTSTFTSTSTTLPSISSDTYKIQIRGNFTTLASKPGIGGGEQTLMNNVAGGGIIPYHKDTTGVYFLLGRNPVQVWNWFGGAKENTDTNPREIAYREAFEEACKIPTIATITTCYLKFKPDIHNAMENGIGLCIPKQITNTSNWSNVYFIKIDKQAWISQNNGKDFVDLPSGTIINNEVDKIKWFTKLEVDNLGNSLQPLLGPIFAHADLVNDLPN